MSDDEEAGVVAPPPPMLQNVPFPPKLEMRGNLANNWKRFKRVWCNYEIASRLIKQGNEERTATLLACLGPDALEIVDGLNFASDEERTNPDIVIQKLETFCIGETNETYERYQFNKRNQELNESIDSYVAVLRNLAKTCNYGTLEENLIRDRIVMGIRENSTRKRLLQESELTLNRCIDICRANESTAIQLKAIGNEEDVNVVKKKSVHGSKGVQKRVSKDIDCKYCGRKHIRKKEDCPAWGKSCCKCGMQNHFADLKLSAAFLGSSLLLILDCSLLSLSEILLYFLLFFGFLTHNLIFPIGLMTVLLYMHSVALDLDKPANV